MSNRFHYIPMTVREVSIWNYAYELGYKKGVKNKRKTKK